MDEKDFPKRVTQGEDGVYRWAYDMNMYENHYLRNVLLKVFAWITLACCAFMMFLFANDGRLTGGVVLVSVLIFAGVMLLVLLGYYIAAAVMHGTYHLRFQMNEDAVMLVRKESTQAFMNAMADITSMTRMASGKPTAGAMAKTAAGSGLTCFSQVRGMKEHPKYNAFNLRTLTEGNQIWVCPEDYEFVADFVKKRIPERVRVR